MLIFRLKVKHRFANRLLLRANLMTSTGELSGAISIWIDV